MAQIAPLFNQSFNYGYKNAEIELVVEDNVITTAKIYMDGECEVVNEITDINGNDLMFTPRNRKAVVEDCARHIDKLLKEDGREVATDMNLIHR
jgi:hypothetical protein